MRAQATDGQHECPPPKASAADPRGWQRGCIAPSTARGPQAAPSLWSLGAGPSSPGWLSGGPTSPLRSHPGPGHPGAGSARVQTHQGALETALPKTFCLVSGLSWGWGWGPGSTATGERPARKQLHSAPSSQPPAALVWGGAPGVDSEPGARPPGQPSSPSSQRPAPSSSSSPGCRPSLRRPSPAPRWVGHQAARRVGAPQGVCRELGSFCPGSGSSDTVWLSAGAWCTQERPSCCPVCPPNCGQSFLGLGGMQGS